MDFVRTFSSVEFGSLLNRVIVQSMHSVRQLDIDVLLIIVLQLI